MILGINEGEEMKKHTEVQENCTLFHSDLQQLWPNESRYWRKVAGCVHYWVAVDGLKLRKPIQPLTFLDIAANSTPE